MGCIKKAFSHAVITQKTEKQIVKNVLLIRIHKLQKKIHKLQAERKIL